MKKVIVYIVMLLLFGMIPQHVVGEGDLTVTGDLKAGGFKEQSFSNLLINGNFELWTDGRHLDPDKWFNYGIPMRYRRNLDQVFGSYCAAIYAGAYDGYTMYQRVNNYANYKGKTLTLSCWVFSSTPNKSRISLRDNTGGVYSDYHSGSGKMELLSATKTIDASATYIQVRLYPGASTWAYFDGAMLVEGLNAVAFNEHPSDALAVGQTSISVTERYVEVGGTTRIKPSDGNAILSLESQESGYGTLELRYKYEDTKHRIGFTDGNGNWLMHSELSTNNLYVPGSLGVGVSGPAYPLQLSNGAYCSVAGVWTDASSREYKEDIKELTTEEAKSALDELKPVTFRYKLDKDDRYTGFIAEEVPELVATRDRKGLASMDIVAVLTKVIQEQEVRIKVLEERLKE